MDSKEIYKLWLENEYFDIETKNELKKIKDNPAEIEERFYKDLEFGTGGLRGIIGAGTNRMNIYTVRKASQGLASYILKKGTDAVNRGVVIAYDCRRKSSEFALESAKVFTANGIKTYLFDELKPTPELSFAVRHLKACAGIVITASHNPKEYNGYKVYGEDGGQLAIDASNEVLDEIIKIDDITSVKIMDSNEAKNKGLLQVIGKAIDDEYINSLKTLCINPDMVKKVGSTMKVVYTPLHGSGNKPVRRILDETGFKNIIVVKEQEKPDTEFSTVKSPNPEEKAAFEIAIKVAQNENASFIIGTDPDSDRVGVVARNSEGEFVALTGNQTGCMLLEYILSQKKNLGSLPANGFVVKTIVTTEMARAITAAYNIELVEVLTGFKFIGEKIKQLDECGNKKYLFGFEESYGYLAGTFARDKDAVVTSMLIAEMAAWYESRNMTLYDGLEELFKKYGYYLEGITSFTLEGKTGIQMIEKAINYLRDNKLDKFGHSKILAVRDYLKSERADIDTGEVENIDLPKSNVMYYELEDSSWFCVRPSGTEPKIKIYYGTKASDIAGSQYKLAKLKDNVVSVIGGLLR